MVPDVGLGMGIFQDSPRTDLSTIKMQNWDSLGRVSGQSQDGPSTVSGIYWDYFGTILGLEIRLYYMWDWDSLRTVSGLGRYWDRTFVGTIG